jgi:hypothetical protein
MRKFAKQMKELHPSWTATLWLDVVLLAVFALWYLWATSFPTYAGLSARHLFAVPAIVGHSGSRYCIRSCFGHTIYGSAYVGPLTFAIICMWAANCAVLMLGAVWSFVKIEFTDEP